MGEARHGGKLADAPTAPGVWRAAREPSFLQSPRASDSISLDSLLPATTDGPDTTLDLGRRLAETWPVGTVVALTGDLGAGKTHLAKGVAAAHGIDPAEVTSPTFTIVQEYADGGLVHLDLYRMESGVDVDGLGLDELFDAFDLALVEWPEHAFGRLPTDTVWLRLEHLGANRRRISQIDAAERTPRSSLSLRPVPLDSGGRSVVPSVDPTLATPTPAATGDDAESPLLHAQSSASCIVPLKKGDSPLAEESQGGGAAEQNDS